ncbi:fatty acid-binding protein, brain-like [Pecten maximus]|uniref:fatty acid-binding protein, brain-like n=1 Tax=Pecten maximus TaxID=6579 RepID=UPI0014590AAD|nr:fatty acid-binding protein, brain-like [Pecten maximus]XP_033753702.1 fatty acid-binding protein, brain-like [Pecten maximus]
MAAVIGYWKLEKNDERWDEYMKTIGVNFVLRKVGNTLTSYEEIVQDGEKWEIHMTSTFKNNHLSFKIGEEFDEVTPDGRNCKSTFMIEDDALVHYQKGIKAGDVNSKVTRAKVDEDTMTVTFIAEGKNVTSMRTYKKHPKP